MRRRAVSHALLALSLTLLGAWAQSARGQFYDPPTSYYSAATGTGSTLKNQLHDIIDGHIVRSYDAARTSLQLTDQDPNNPNRMLLVYNRVSLDVSAINPGGPIPGWNNGTSWDREHTWPRAKGVDESGPDNSDLHNLRPSTPSVNNSRGNLNFGGAYGQTFGQKTDKGNTVWYPGDADAGMIARQQFYMAVRYDGSDSNTTNLELVNGAPGIGGTTQGDLARLLEWHYQAVPDEFERRRNHVIYGLAGADGSPPITNSNNQGNRNPFIDRPEFVWSVFVDQQNDSQLYVGASPNSNGGSQANVNLGRVIVGAAVPSPQNVTLHKNGLDGTYYEITTGGSATSSVTGRWNAFPILTSGTDSRVLSVGLDTNTATAGQRSGSITINNLDITTAGGSGRGANDANDLINVSLDVLAHANPSFSLVSNQNTLDYDFGTVALGSNVPGFNFTLANLVSTAGYTAALDFDSVSISGDGTKFPTNLFTFSGVNALDAGSSIPFTAAIDTSSIGDFSATYTLNFSDVNLPGATSLGSLTLNLLGNVEAAPIDSADFDGDGDVDGRDFLIWQRGFGSGSTLAEGDANNSGTVDEDDLLVWQTQYGQPSGLTGHVTVPEPNTAVMLLITSGLGMMRRRR